MSAPYDLVYSIMYAAMMRLNDTINTLQPIGGQILQNAQAFSQQSVNNAWRREQDWLRNLGYQSLKNEVDFSAVPPVGTTDPLVQAYLSWAGYWNGVTLNAAFTLPQDFVSPLDLWERISGSQSNMLEMDEMINGLPSIPKLQWNRMWQWRNENLYFPGAIVPTDFRVSYAKYNLDFLDNAPAANTPWFEQTVPIMNVQESLAWFICYEYAIARADLADAAPTFKMNAEDSAQLVFNRDVRRPTSIYKASEYSKMRDKFTPAAPDGKPPKPLIG